jgi:large subunit ribosomal protein L29
MKTAEVREMNADELQSRIAELEEELFRSRIQNATGQLENPVRLRYLRRDLARCKTIQREKAAQSEGTR